MPYPEQLHPQLQPMRLASRNGRMYVGPCPFCPAERERMMEGLVTGEGRGP